MNKYDPNDRYFEPELQLQEIVEVELAYDEIDIYKEYTLSANKEKALKKKFALIRSFK